jgi:hypothetical protein
MDHHLTNDQIRGYHSRAMGASALLDADRHLAECAACRHELQRIVPAPALPSVVLEMGDPVHLSYEQIADHIDATLTDADREQVERHTSICRRCAKELADLQAFDTRMAMGQQTAAPARQVEQRVSWLTRMQLFVAQFLGAPQRVRFSLAGIALIVVGTLSLLHAVQPDFHSGTRPGLLAYVSPSSAGMHPHFFYGGFLIAGCGAAALLYGLLKRQQ